MPGNPNERRIYVRFKQPSYVEEIELAAHASSQTLQDWSRTILMQAARKTKEKAHLETTLLKSQLIVRKVMEKKFPEETKEAEDLVEEFLDKLNTDD